MKPLVVLIPCQNPSFPFFKDLSLSFFVKLVIHQESVIKSLPLAEKLEKSQILKSSIWILYTVIRVRLLPCDFERVVQKQLLNINFLVRMLLLWIDSNNFHMISFLGDIVRYLYQTYGGGRSPSSGLLERYCKHLKVPDYFIKISQRFERYSWHYGSLFFKTI